MICKKAKQSLQILLTNGCASLSGVKRREGSCWRRKCYQLLDTLCPQELRMTLGQFLACMHVLFWTNGYASYNRPRKTNRRPMTCYMMFRTSANLRVNHLFLSQKTWRSKDVRTLEGASASAIRKMAGNGMHLPSAAFTALIAMICMSPTEGSQKDWFHGFTAPHMPARGENSDTVFSFKSM